jgi:hypothetical protein
MVQLYFKDSGMLVHEGLTEAEYRAWPGFKDNDTGIIDTGQTFDKDRIKNDEVWFYVKETGLFWQSTEETHAFWAAAAAQFTSSRWTEIEQILEENGDMRHHLHKLKHAKITGKAEKQEAKGLITNAELQTLKKIFK